MGKYGIKYFLLQEVKSLEEARTLLISQKVDIQNKIGEMEEKVRKVHYFSGKMTHFICSDNIIDYSQEH